MREFSIASCSASSREEANAKQGNDKQVSPKGIRWGNQPMSSKRRALILAVGQLGLLALLVLLQTATAAPQQAPPAKVPPGAALPPLPVQQNAGPQQATPIPAAGLENEFTDAITLPTDRQVKQRLVVARDDYIKNEAWSDAATLLQKILDSKEDVFVQVPHKN